LKERRSLSQLEFTQLEQRVAQVTLRWRWTWRTMEMECQALSLHDHEPHIPDAQAEFRSWPSHGVAEALRIWFWRQTPRGKESIKRSHPKKLTKKQKRLNRKQKREALHATA
jgi:hypothetical protein